MGLRFKLHKRCPECKAELIPREGQPMCPTMSCPRSPLATLASVRQPASTAVPPGYRPANHSLPPADMSPGATGHRRGLDPHPSVPTGPRRQRAWLNTLYQPAQHPPPLPGPQSQTTDDDGT